MERSNVSPATRMRCVRRVAAALVPGAALFAAGPFARAANGPDTWLGSSSAFWSDPANWAGTNTPPISGDSLVFGAAGTAGATLSDDLMTPATYDVAGITFNSGADAFVINPATAATNGFTLTGDVANNSASLETINDLIALSGTRTFTLTTGGGNITLGGAVSGAGGGITTAGAGTLTLSVANSYTGPTSIGAGTTISTPVAGGLGASSSTAVGGTLNLTLNQGVNTNATYTGLATVTGGGTINVTLGTGAASNNASTLLNGNYAGFTGVINLNAGALAQAGKAQMNGADNAAATVNVLGNGTLYVSAAVTKNASLFLNGGTTGEALGQLRLESGGIWAGPVTLKANTTIGANTGTGTISGPIGQSGGTFGFTKLGAGTIALTSGNNTYAGATGIGAGTLSLSGGNNRLPATTTIAFTGTSTLNVNGTSQTAATLTVPDLTGITATVSGTTGGSLTLNGATDLQLGPGGALAATAPAIVVNMSALPSFTYNAPANLFRVGLKAGSSNSTTATGTSTVTLAAANTITASALDIGDQAASQSGGTSILKLGASNTVNVNNIFVTNGRSNATLQFNAAGSSATFRNTNGTSPITQWNVGVVNNYTSNTWTATADFANGTLDASVGTLLLGNADINSQTGRGGTINANFSMGAGSLTATNLFLGKINGTATNGISAGGTLFSNSTFTLNSATGALNAGTITLASNTIADTTATATKKVTATFNLTNGTLKATTIQLGPQTGTATTTAAFNWTAGTIQNTDLLDLSITKIPITLASGIHTFNATGSNSIALDANSPVSGASDIAKSGTGTLTLLGTNTYTGTTSVTAGTLLINSPGMIGSGAGAGNVSVTGASILGGTGTVNLAAGATVNIDAGATLTPGTVTAPGNFTVNGAAGNLTTVLTLAPGSNFQVALTHAAASELFVNNGGITLSGANLVLVPLDNSLQVGDSFTIIDPPGDITGQFATGTSGTSNGITYSLAYNTTASPETVTLTVTGVPEPTCLGLLAVGGLGLLARRRRVARLA